MPRTPAINAAVTITSTSIKGDSVIAYFNEVNELNFDYYKGMVRINDRVQGEFYFSLLTPVTVTYTIAGSTTTVVIT